MKILLPILVFGKKRVSAAVQLSPLNKDHEKNYCQKFPKVSSPAKNSVLKNKHVLIFGLPCLFSGLYGNIFRESSFGINFKEDLEI